MKSGLREKRGILTGLVMALALAGVTGCGSDAGEQTKEATETEFWNPSEAETGGESAQPEENDKEASHDVAKGEENGQGTDVGTPEGGDEDKDDMEFLHAKTMHGYSNVLSQLLASYSLPDVGEVEVSYDSSYHMDENGFAIGDVDGDGRDELIINYTAASMAGMFSIVYDYNPETEKLNQELMLNPFNTFYDNGIVIEEASHNHSMGMDFWPYTMYQYDADSDTYVVLASVTSWQKEFAEQNYDGEPFPDEFDRDGDGEVYNIIDGETDGNSYNASAYRYDKEDYEKWYKEHMGTAKEIKSDIQALDYEAFRDYTPDYLSLLMDRAKKALPDISEDVGIATVDCDNFLEQAEKFISEECDYGVSFRPTEEDWEDFKTGFYEDREVFELVYMDGGSLTYKEEQVGNLTVFGLYPGMSESEAIATLETFGFYPYGEGDAFYVTGVGFDNRSVWLDVEDGKISQITATSFCAFAG